MSLLVLVIFGISSFRVFDLFIIECQTKYVHWYFQLVVVQVRMYCRYCHLDECNIYIYLSEILPKDGY